MKVIRKFDGECENINYISVVLLGGINKEDDWRSKVIDELQRLCDLDNQEAFPYDLVIYSPEKSNNIVQVDKLDKDWKYLSENEKTKRLMKWDYDKLKEADIKSIYFSDTSSQSLSMFELGYLLGNSNSKLVISINEGFRRNKELMYYIDMIYSENYVSSFVNPKATPESHALAIYTRYKYLLYRKL